jgi:hypothetical protein
MLLGDAWEPPEEWPEDIDLGPLDACPTIPDSVQVGWVWEPFAGERGHWLPYALWREQGHAMEMTYEPGASLHWT